jgi:drug/metabolite transporter (DMT)-like permease
MAPSLLALLAALLWGTDDFLGGRLARRIPAVTVVLWAAAVSAVVSTGIAVASGPPEEIGGALGWGAAAGVGSAVGAMSLYRGLVVGRAAVVAPTAGVVGAAFPVAVGVVGGDRPDLLAWLGVALALPAIWLMSATPGTRHSSSGLLFGLAAGVGFGWLLTCLGLAPDGSGLWPVAASKTAGIAFAASTLALRRTVPRVTAPVWGGLVVVGLVDVGASASYLFATERGLLSLVAVLASLYPAPTVALAAVWGGERPAARQVAGAAMAIGSAALISV